MTNKILIQRSLVSLGKKSIGKSLSHTLLSLHLPTSMALYCGNCSRKVGCLTGPGKDGSQTIFGSGGRPVSVEMTTDGEKHGRGKKCLYQLKVTHEESGFKGPPTTSFILPASGHAAAAM